MKRILLLTAILFLAHTQMAHAQMALDQGQFTVYAGISSPTGDFGDDSGDLVDENGYAKLGLTLIGEYTYPIGTPGLGLVASVSLMANGFDGDEFFEGADDAGVDVNSGYWFNLPIMGGLKYQTQASPTLGLYGMGQVGLNFNKGPSTELEDEGGNTINLSYGTATSFGFGLGAGMTLNNRYHVSLRYLRLGEPEVEIELEVDGDTVDDDYDQPISMIQLVVGIDL